MTDLVLYTSVEVAELLRMNHQVIQRKLQAGEIPGYRIGREWRVERQQLVAWLEEHSNQRDEANKWFDPEGGLRALPARRSRRRAVLERMVSALEPGRVYKEAELNGVLRKFHDDVASLRREMVAERLLVRTRDGVYKRASSRQAVLRRA
jgi:excisionase family DNA binding protein